MKYKSSWSDSDSSWNDLETFFNNSMETGLIGDLPISNDCNRSHVCRLWSIDGKPKSVFTWQVKVAFIYFDQCDVKFCKTRDACTYHRNPYLFMGLHNRHIGQV